MITYPYALELREGAMLVSTDLLVKGRNPFAWEEQPQHTNIYGIFYHIVIYPFAKIWSANNLVHRSVTAVFILGSCFIIGLVLKRLKVPFYHIFPAATLLYAFLLFPGTTTPFAGPHSLGLFLFLLSVFIPWFKNYSPMSLGISLAAGILAFYTKPYFILGLPFLTCYLFLFISKKKGIIFGAGWGIVLLISIFMMKNICEAYFSNTFFVNLYGADTSLTHCVKQFSIFIHQNLEMLEILIFGTFLQVFHIFKKDKKPSNTFPQINLRNFKNPLISFPFDLSLFCLIFSTALIYFKLGRHGGSWMAYLFHLMSPFFIIIVFTSLKKDFWRILAIPLIAINIHTVSSHHFKIKAEESLKHWETVRDLVSKHKNIFNSPTIVSLLLEQKKPIYDSGLTECFHIGEAKDSILNPIFLKEDRVAEVNLEFRRKIQYKITHKEFDMLMITKNWYVQLPPNETKKHYKFLGTISIEMPYFPQSWTLGIWMPR